MVRKIAIAVLAAQMSVGLCAVYLGARGDTTCCKPADKPCPIQMSCTCCGINSVNLTSLAAPEPFTVAPATHTVVLVPGRESGLLPSRPAQIQRALDAAATHSPPRLYLRNESLLI